MILNKKRKWMGDHKFSYEKVWVVFSQANDFCFFFFRPAENRYAINQTIERKCKFIFSIFSQSCSYTVPISSLIWSLAKPSPGDWESIKDLGSSNTAIVWKFWKLQCQSLKEEAAIWTDLQRINLRNSLQCCKWKRVGFGLIKMNYNNIPYFFY